MLIRLYDRLILGLAGAAGAGILAATALIILDVVLRNIGMRPLQATSAVVEYAMLFATMATAPWLVRTGGHVAIGVFTDSLHGPVRRVLGQAVTLAAALALALLAWRAGAVGLEMVAQGSVDMRSVNIPSWVLYAMLAGGFALMATEFLRLLLRGGFYSGGGGVH